MDEAGNEMVDEINMYYDCRYISACEAAWRLFSFEVQYRTLPVERVSFHLPDCQSVVFQDDDTIDHVLNRETVGQSMFNAWFVANQKFKEASLLTYIEMPTKFVWKKDIREWHPRKKGFSIGRIFYVPPASGEIYYLRCLLNIICGPKGFQDIRTVNGVEYLTFRDACYAHGLLDDDKEYIDAINEASYWSTAHSLRKLFVVLLTSSSIIRPENVWNQVWQHLCEDAQHYQRRILKQQDLVLTEEEKKNFALLELENLLGQQNKSLKDYPPMPIPSTDNSRLFQNRLVFEELCYNREQLKEDAELLCAKLTEEQSLIYDTVIQDIADGNRQALQEFVDWIANVGDGKLGGRNDGFAEVEIPKHMLLSSERDDIKTIVHNTFPMFANGNTDPEHLLGRAILAPTLDVVNTVNDYMTELHNAESRSYYSSDAVCKADGDNGIFGDVHTPEFLNSIRVSGLRNHTLTLKIGSLVMLIRNIDHSLGLCNGTRLIITKLADHVIEGEILTGPNKGTKVLIPRMSMSPSDPRLPFKFQRRQFPLMLSYAMTINKSQGQTLTHVGLILKKPVFVHGQLYVAASRVNNPDDLKILIVKDPSSTTTSTTNVVYHEVFNNL
ncbi:PREDICTED: uncharacterized protein LOC109149930 [Ipomoea nil]|uniref:uncharacterized protein LOC109149930 n=1 Tax=Ipomoea nil TaxID=35883 RepID=UPI0009019D1D|nr:PREDICTED: uncharacterized protein LOC109149930 [Ipomoea nil]